MRSAVSRTEALRPLQHLHLCQSRRPHRRLLRRSPRQCRPHPLRLHPLHQNPRPNPNLCPLCRLFRLRPNPNLRLWCRLFRPRLNLNLCRSRPLRRRLNQCRRPSLCG